MRLFALPRRIWKCLHPFTWLVMLVVGVGLVIIVVPGQGRLAVPWFAGTGEEWAYETIGGTDVAYVEELMTLHLHGWPLPCAARAVADEPLPLLSTKFIPSPPRPLWMDAANWPFQGESWCVHWINLLVDFAVVLIVLIGTAVLTELWLRRRGGLWRFRIVDFFAVATAVAVIVAWHQGHVRLRHREKLLIDSYGVVEYFRTLQNIHLPPSEYQYCGPVWLQRLVGNEELLPFLHHQCGAGLGISGDNWREDLGTLQELPYLHQLSIGPVLPREAIAELANFPRLKSLELSTFDDDTTDPHVTKKMFNDGVGNILSPQQLDELAVLPLEALSLAGSAIIIDDIERIVSAMPQLRTLSLRDASITLEEVEDIRRDYPGLEVQAEWGSENPFDFDGAPPPDHQQHVAEVKRHRAERLQQESTAR